MSRWSDDRWVSEVSENGDVSYVRRTTLPEDLNDLNKDQLVALAKRAEWLVDLIVEEQNSRSAYRPIHVLGKAYKPETNLTVGSPAGVAVSGTKAEIIERLEAVE